ncbi:UDP-N-acetylmuramate dehydrogenase [Subdoligranulum sp. DSM 109015]|uniref:UDP-N-acetylenolpyruvoylglucosamine reductase n=2 Tax=Gemmiger gallinarum TaxID=2779354 RepID=A0ABR9R149_9FIRM|nr:UDP-N-acetylmuramate dehydrogenase [Gemmiger gallinarum]
MGALRGQQIPFVEKEPLSRHTTFRIGGPAAVLCLPETPAQLLRALELCREYGVRTYLLGNGSNTLFADEGFDGAVICTVDLRAPITVTGTTVSAPAGASLAAVCREAQKAGLTGLEFAYGIPGTVGGAVYMNAGAYGGELKQVLSRVTFLDKDLRLETLPVEELALGYRTSRFETDGGSILEAVFQLQPGAPQAIEARMQELMARRREKQPLELPSAGSTFKRPEGAFAGQLIEQCGLRGFAVGGAAVSTKHCGFVVNTGGATCADVIRLTDEIQKIVEEKTGYRLSREIRVVR